MEARAGGAAAYLLRMLDSLRRVASTSQPVISIVEDDDSVRAATEALIRSLGYVAATFRSGEEFLRSDRLHSTSCLITDLQMPGMSGIELQSRLIAAGVHVPIIFVTAAPAPRARVQVLEAGATAFLSKPLRHEALISTLAKALAQQAA